jgi:hypothetical protein
MNKIALLVAALAACLTLTACEKPAAPVPVPQAEEKPQEESQRSGLGMTYRGKPGIEIMPGIVMGFDGEIGLGFGL